MPNTWMIQSNMNGGETSPLIEGRKDVQLYYNSLETAENVLSLPQGGMTKRDGTKTIAQINDIVRIEPFSFNTEQNYLLGFAPSLAYVFKNDVILTSFVIPYTAEQILAFIYKQSADTAIIFHEDVQTRLITRDESENFSIATATFTNMPQFNFNDALSPVGVAETHAMIFKDASNGDTFKLSLNDLLTEEIVFSETDPDGTARAMADALQNLVNTGNSGITAVYNGKDSGNYLFAITFAGESANDWDVLVAVPVTTKKTTFEVEIEKTGADGVSPKEDSWSANRGWPRCGTFFQGRLWIGGSRDRPTTLWGSRSSDFFNFKLGRGLDNEAIEKTLDTDQLNAIVAVVGNRSLQVFTTGQEFFISDTIITPENSNIIPQTNVGAKAVSPVVVDGVTVFVQKTGKSLVQFVYNDQYKANQSNSISFAAEHLIKDPINLCVLKGTSSRDAVYMFINNTDGTVSVFNSLASEEVAGFTQYLIAQDDYGLSKIKWSAILDDTLYHIVERTLDSGVVRTIEKERADVYLDSSVTGLTPHDEHVAIGPLFHHGVCDSLAKTSTIWPDNRVASGASTSYELSFDTTDRKLYVLNIHGYSGANCIQNIIKIDLDTWIVEKGWDYTNTDIPKWLCVTDGDGEVRFKNKVHGGKHLVFFAQVSDKEFLFYFNGETEELVTYVFIDRTYTYDGVTYTYTQNTTNELVAFFGSCPAPDLAFVDETTMKVWLLFTDYNSGQYLLGYIDLSKIEDYELVTVATLDDNDLSWEISKASFQSDICGLYVDESINRVIISTASNGGTSSDSGMLHIYTTDGMLIKRFEKNGDDFPYTGIRNPIIYNGKVYGGVGGTYTSNPTERGLVEIDLTTFSVTYHIPDTFGGSGDYTYSFSKPTILKNGWLAICCNYGIALFNTETTEWKLLDSTEVYGITPAGTAVDAFFGQCVYDEEKDLLIAGMPCDYPVRSSLGVVAVDIYQYVKEPEVEPVGLDHLEGLEASVVADDTYLGEYLVQDATIKDLPTGYTTYEIGLLYRPRIKTQKINFDTRGGPIAHRKKKITQAAISLYNSNGVIVNGKTLPDKTVGVDVFGPNDDGKSKNTFTGVKKLRMLGWTNDAQIEITQDTPDPLTVRSIGMEVTI